MIKLISRWTLKSGLTPELLQHLACAAQQVEHEENGTLMYLIHLEAPNPLDSSGEPIVPAPKSIPADDQKTITFIEIYKDAKAFQAHLNGPAFTGFLSENLNYFVENPDKPGWPESVTYFLEQHAGFTRPCLNDS